VYDLGKLLQTDLSLSIFELHYRPWPHIYQDRGRSKKFYKAMDRHLERDLLALNNFMAREDSGKYTILLRKVLELFGLGIIDSLEFTLSKYLRQTNGVLANDTREDWEEDAQQGMLCHNNNAERPFAVLRSYKRTYPSMSLRNLSKLSQTLTTGTHKPGDKDRAAGSALTADPRLRVIIGDLCGVRNKRVGLITSLLRAAHYVDHREMLNTRKRKSREKYETNVRKKAKKAALRDHAEEINSNSLVTDVGAFQAQLAARENSVKARVTFLKDQFHARVSGNEPRMYTSLGPEFRTKHGKLRLTSQCKSMSEVTYLTSLLNAMIEEDGDAIGLNANKGQSNEQFIRLLPTISLEYYNPKAANLKEEFSQQIAALATPTDDPVYLVLHDKYVTKVLYDFETRASSKLFRVAAIQFVRSYTTARFSCWEATCEPVYRDSNSGHFHVPSEVQVPGSKVTLTHALQGYCVAEYANGIDAEPTYLPWVDQYISYFNTDVLPKYSLAEKTSSTDSPSSMALPAKRRPLPRRRKCSSVADDPEDRE
jgi:hypothetical protein